MSEPLKKTLFVFGISLLILGLVFGGAFFIHSKTRINNHDEAKYGVFRIRLVGAGWDLGERPRLVRESILELNRLGPTIQLVDSGEHLEAYLDQVAVSGARNCYAGLYTPGIRPRIKLVPTCITSNIEFQSTFMHEVGHALGMQHICRKHREVADCSPVGHQVSFMNPGLDYFSSSGGTDIVTEIERVSSVPMIEVTGRDVDEFKRNWRGVRY
jgi:hypothetical protein